MQNREIFIKKCLELATKGMGYVSPNPMVGCVIVFNNQIIGEGYHKKYGTAHAEINAIENVKDKSLLKKSTLYVNLEPCVHFGKTPPCTNLIIESEIPKVVIGCRDSYSEVSGKGIEKMQNIGIEVIVGVLEKINIKTGGFAIFIAMFAGFVEPDEEQFSKAKKISRLRLIGAGPTSNVIFAFALGAILFTNPMFAMVVPEPFLSSFYEEAEDGVLVLSLIDGGGAQQAGIQENDVIIKINDVNIASAIDLQKNPLEPGEMVNVTILRDGSEVVFPVTIMASPDDPERGLIGIMRNDQPPKPIYNFIDWGLDTPMGFQFSMFLLWLWMISFFIGIINMLPLPILDGGKFIHTIIEGKISEKAVNGAMMAVYAFTFIIFGLNIGLSYYKSGWFTI